MNHQPDAVYTHSPNIVTRKTGNEYVLVPLTGNIADMNSVFTLNETGAFIWEQIDGKKNLGVILDLVVEEFEADRERAESDLNDFIGKLTEWKAIRSI
jgi:hypothetical protein